MRALSVLIVALVLVPILQAQAGEAEEGTMLMALDAKFDAEVAARGVDAWVSFFAPNGIQGRGDRPPVVGHAAIREHMTKGLAKPTTLRWKPTASQIQVPGKLGTTTGRYELNTRDPKGRPVKAAGTYLTVWQRQADGAWKVIYDTGVPDPPAPKK